jgi:acyl-CoA reductase-like NAD-dependent aldehyde dehydrogenase
MKSPPERAPFIAGASRTTSDIIEVRSPHDQEIVARVHRGGPSEIEAAIASAVEGFEVMRRMPAHRRAAILTGMAREVASRRDELAHVLAREAGKPLKAAYVEADRTVHTLDTAAEEARRPEGEIIPFDVAPWGEGRMGMVRRFPLGPIAGITPFNFPLNLTAHKVAPALAAGNSIVIKPATQTPSPGILMAEIAASCGAPAGAVNVIPASPRDASPLVDDPRMKMLTFTGSGAVGWELKQRAFRKRVTLELGGNAAAIVCADADIDFAAGRVVAGGYGYSGQSCISVQRVLVEAGVFNQFLDALVSRVKQLVVGDPLSEATDVGPLISPDEAVRASAWIEEAVAGGATLLTGGQREGSCMTPAVLTGTTRGMKVNCREIFAPVVTVSSVASMAEGIREANNSRYGLQAGIFTRDSERAWSAYEALEAGGVIINDVPTYRVDHMPYGGIKESGVGREGIRYAIEEMTEPKLMVWNRPDAGGAG